MIDSRLFILAGSFTAASVIALLVFLRKNGDEGEGEDEASVREATSRQSVVEVLVPRAAIGHVIGRDGCNIRQIQQDTNTRIKFKESEFGSEERVCVVRGRVAEGVHEAQRLIHKAIRDRPVVTTITIAVPQESCGRIIGRNGDTIRELCSQSQAKILVDRGVKTPPDGMRIVTLTGTESQLAVAKQLIREKVQEESDMRRRIAVSTAARTRRVGGKLQPSRVCLLDVTGASPSYDRHHGDRVIAADNDDDGVVTCAGPSVSGVQRCERLLASAADGFVEVFVSAVDTAGHFWLQVKSLRSVELDRLGDTMAEFYSSAAQTDIRHSRCGHTPADSGALNPALHDVGNLVAARFPHDPLWYRGQVVHVNRAADGSPASLLVYYVDYGDTDTVPAADVAPLHVNFASLPQQAIECFLAHVRPVGDSWSDASSECFETLTYAAQWKSIMARVVKYQPSAGGRRLPVVQLVDTNTAQDVDVARELVKRGHASWLSGGGGRNTAQDRGGSDTELQSRGKSPIMTADSASNAQVAPPATPPPPADAGEQNTLLPA